MSQPNIIDTMLEKVKTYISVNTELFTLKIVQHIATASGKILWIFLVSTCVIMMILFSSIGLALYLSNCEANWHQGFFIISGIYLLICIIILIVHKKMSKFIGSKVIHNLLNEDDDNNND